MIKKILLYLSLSLVWSNWSYAQSFELKDCYIKNYYSFTQGKELEGLTSKEFNKNKNL